MKRGLRTVDLKSTTNQIIKNGGFFQFALILLSTKSARLIQISKKKFKLF